MKKFGLLGYVLIGIFGFCHFALAQPETDLELNLRIIDKRTDYHPTSLHDHKYLAIDLYNLGNNGVWCSILVSFGSGIDRGSSFIINRAEWGVRGNTENELGYFSGGILNEVYVQPGCRERSCPSTTIYIGPIEINDVNDSNITAEILPSVDEEINYDIDSSPGNGVDTDGDGLTHHDPDDEDDGDGIDFSLFTEFEPLRPCCQFMRPAGADYAYCPCDDEETDTAEEPDTANPDVIAVSAEGSLVGSGGISGATTPPSASGGNPLGRPLTPAPASGGTLSAEAGCMIAADVPSPVALNPEGTEGFFKFDYYIESLARFSFIDDGIRQEQELNVNYYVNSNDGSMFFSTETGGFFGANAFATADRMGEIHGVVWKADGQRVIYALERVSGTLRAVILAQDQTAADVAGQKFLNVTEFVNSMGSMTRGPDPLPPHLASKWGDVPGYIGNMNDVDGTKSTVTIYMGRSPDIAPIATSSPLVGFLVGVFKDHVHANCNKLAVYTRMTLDSSDDYIEIELVDIRPASFEFNGNPYKRTEMGAIPGSTAGNRMQAYNAQMDALMIREQAAKTARRNCARNDIACFDSYTAEIEQLKREQEALECEMACEMGMEELYDDCNCP